MEQKQPATEAMGDTGRIGATLGAARIAAGIELVDIARDTRVPVRHLRAIEADAHDSLPALPYSVGFVKSFARAVGVDPETAAARFRAETSKTAHVPAAVALEPLDERRLPPRELVVFSIIAVVALLGGLIAYGAGLFDKAPPPPPVVITTAAPATPDTSAPGAAMTMTPDAGIAAPVVGAPATGATVPTSGGQVTMTPTEDVWIKIYDGQGVSVKAGILTAGSVYTVPANPPGLKLWTGKAGVLGIAVGAKKLTPLGGPAQTIKDVSLAPADLLANNAAAASAAAAPTAVAR